MREPQIAQATPEKLKWLKRKCWSPPCKNRAWLRDGEGWQWCWHHYWRNMRWDGREQSIKSYWTSIKLTKIY